VSHPRAKLTVHGRWLLVERVLELGWRSRWPRRHRGARRRPTTSGSAGSPPRAPRASGTGSPVSRSGSRDPRQAPGDARRPAPDRLGARGSALDVHRVLRRLGAPRLRDLDRPTRVIVRYERERPGELVHVGIRSRAGSSPTPSPAGSAFDLASDGSLSNRRVWAENVGPDGICLDADGAVWTQRFHVATSGGGGRVRAVSANWAPLWAQAKERRFQSVRS
jgi:hypothetical protein